MGVRAYGCILVAKFLFIHPFWDSSDPTVSAVAPASPEPPFRFPTADVQPRADSGQCDFQYEGLCRLANGSRRRWCSVSSLHGSLYSQAASPDYLLVARTDLTTIHAVVRSPCTTESYEVGTKPFPMWSSEIKAVPTSCRKPSSASPVIGSTLIATRIRPSCALTVSTIRPPSRCRTVAARRPTHSSTGIPPFQILRRTLIDRPCAL